MERHALSSFERERVARALAQLGTSSRPLPPPQAPATRAAAPAPRAIPFEAPVGRDLTTRVEALFRWADAHTGAAAAFVCDLEGLPLVSRGAAAGEIAIAALVLHGVPAFRTVAAGRVAHLAVEQPDAHRSYHLFPLLARFEGLTLGLVCTTPLTPSLVTDLVAAVTSLEEF